MNTQIQNYMFTALILFTSACGGALKYKVASNNKAPGADANIVADIKKEQVQTVLDIKIANLPPPSRVTSGAKHYVAWYRKDNSSAWVRLAAFKYDEGSRKAELMATVPETIFDFETSAESEPTVASPSPDVVVSQRVGGE